MATAMKTTAENDPEVRGAIQDELHWEPRIDDREIGVAVKDGVATLTGTVPNYFEKWEAGSAAGRIQGVKAVANDIEVHLPGDARRSDTDIARTAAQALAWNVSLPADRVMVTVSDGQVTLTGELDWGYQRWAAEEAIRHLVGVRGVTNEILVVSRLKPADVKSLIERAFRRSAAVDSRHVKVEAVGGRVTLRGHVRTWVERHEAEKAAWAAPGVTQVENLINLTPAAL